MGAGLIQPGPGPVPGVSSVNGQTGSVSLATTNLTDVVGRTAFTPVFTFATPGDLAVTYISRTGFYYRIGSMLFWWITMNITPTYTTASGNAYVQGFPVNITNLAGIAGGGDINFLYTITWPTGVSQITPNLSILGGTTTMQFYCTGATVNNAILSVTNFPSISTGSYNMSISGFYPVT